LFIIILSINIIIYILCFGNIVYLLFSKTFRQSKIIEDYHNLQVQLSDLLFVVDVFRKVPEHRWVRLQLGVL